MPEIKSSKGKFNKKKKKINEKKIILIKSYRFILIYFRNATLVVNDCSSKEKIQTNFPWQYKGNHCNGGRRENFRF